MTEKVSESQITNATRIRNLLIALAAIVLSVSMFLGFQAKTSSVSLEAQAAESTALEVALTNGKPTLAEFYANWCTSCQAMTQDLAEIKQEYANSVNFVMLNVDNNKWLPEILRYRVDGIPHFVFLNQDGNAIAQAIGEQPRSVMQANLKALVANLSLPYAYSSGQTSIFNTPATAPKTSPDAPRSHSSQVKS